MVASSALCALVNLFMSIDRLQNAPPSISVLNNSSGSSAGWSKRERAFVVIVTADIEVRQFQKDRVEQARAVSNESGRRFLLMFTQPQRMLSLLPRRISVHLPQSQRKQIEKRFTQAHDCAEEGSDRKHR